jgi:hypothetical protein
MRKYDDFAGSNGTGNSSRPKPHIVSCIIPNIYMIHYWIPSHG